MNELEQGAELAFVADTQAPMWIETLLLRRNDNVKATKAIFEDLLARKPQTLYWLGDVVVVGARRGAWPIVDKFLEDCLKADIPVRAILGNHDVMGRPRKGARNFQLRFPEHVSTGYCNVTDSVAVILLNSNFGVLSRADIAKQQEWYETKLKQLENDPEIKAIIVTCHHAPFTNSRLVGSSKPVQQRFVPSYLQSTKAVLFITGHAHAFERFRREGKDFLVIGGGGGLTQPLNASATGHADEAADYKPFFHYLTVRRVDNSLSVQSHRLTDDRSGFVDGYQFTVVVP